MWTQETTAAFTAGKHSGKHSLKPPCSSHPKPSAITCIITDASDAAVGVALQQLIDGVWCTISFFSKKLKPPKTRYSTFDRELLAVYLAMKTLPAFCRGT